MPCPKNLLPYNTDAWRFIFTTMQGPSSPPTRGSRWMTAGLVQDADLDSGTVARVVTKPFTSCQAPLARSAFEGRPLTTTVR